MTYNLSYVKSTSLVISSVVSFSVNELFVCVAVVVFVLIDNDNVSFFLCSSCSAYDDAEDCWELDSLFDKSYFADGLSLFIREVLFIGW